MSTSGRTNTNAILALVLGILSFMGGSLLTGIPAWILGKSAIKDIDAGVGSENDRNMAKIGLILGQIAVALSVLAGCIMLIFMSSFFAAFSGVNSQSIEDQRGTRPRVEMEGRQLSPQEEQMILDQTEELRSGTQ